MRLIDADALREELDSILNWHTNDEYNMYSDTMVAIDNAPTVDEKLVIHGVWEKDGTRCECSNCSAFANLGHARVWKHCPMCGAEMEGIME